MSQAQGWGTWPTEYRHRLVVLIRQQVCLQCRRAHALGHDALWSCALQLAILVGALQALVRESSRVLQAWDPFEQ